jgi:hypothetical protein
LAAVLLGSILVSSAAEAAAQELTSTPDPQLSLDHLIETSPFTGSTTRVFDNEGSAYVPVDDALWMADDQGDALFEVDRTTGELRRRIPQSAFAAAPRVGTGAAAGPLRNEDLEALAYDANADVLYAFSGSTPSAAGPSEPTVYRLARGVDDRLQVQSWRAVATESAAAGWRLADGLTYVGNRSTIRSFDYATNTFGAPFSVSGLARILGLDFDDASGDLLAVTNRERLFRASMTTHALVEGWNGIDLTGLGLLDTRAVEVIGEQLLVTDGFDLRENTDPMQHAVFVLGVTTDTTGPVVTITTPPDGATYPRNQVVHAAFSCADTAGGTGVASCAGTVPAGEAVDTATTGPKSFTVTATDNAGNTTEVTHDYTVVNSRPDGRIRRGTGLVVGNNIYNTTGVGQTRTGSAARGGSVRYHVSAQNDAPLAERFRLRGRGSNDWFRVRYLSPTGVDITGRVVAGTYLTPSLAPGAIHRIQAVVTVRFTAPRNAVLTRTVTARSEVHPTIRDTVRFVTRRA